MTPCEQNECIYNGHRLIKLTPARPRGTLIWFHGGGWMIELGEDSVAWGRDLAKATGLCVLMPDYPLAREWQYPRLNGWCSDCWRDLAQQSEISAPGPVLIGGDSAGAHLALCALPARRPDAAIFVYPVTTLLPVRNMGSWNNFRRGWPLSPRLMDYFYDAYCPNQEDRLGASPLEQLENIPPTLMITAGEDILADQQHAFAQRFSVSQKVYPTAHHIFLSREEGREHRAQALKDIAEGVKRFLEQGRF